MENYKKRFIELMVRANVLKFGRFDLKSGRVAPYFINSGSYQDGMQITQLGQFYAERIKEIPGRERFVLYGPAYKGIPLVISTAVALYSKYHISLPYFFNRKEVKNHGEGGIFVGHQPEKGDGVLIIEDVVTAGTAFRESVDLITPTGAKVEAMVVAVNRQERGSGEKGAFDEIRDSGVDPYSVVDLDDVVTYLRNTAIDGKLQIDDDTFDRINDYRAKYGDFERRF